MQVERLLNSRIFFVERLSYDTPAGDAMQRDVVRHPGSVAIVPILEGDRLCLIRNHRVTVNDTLIEVPAGTMEPPEPAFDCAHRELIEETGYRAGKMQLAQSFFPAPGILDEEMHLFVATDLTAGDPAREAGEQIENFIVSFAEARQLVSDKKIRDAKTMLAILMLDELQSLL